MDSNYLKDMVQRSAPVGAAVLRGSTPVVSFGDPSCARVASLGINPSKNEFVDKTGALLSGTERRLATLESLGVEDLARIGGSHAAQVVEDCNTYFQRRPYRRWFDVLDEVLSRGTGASYYDGSACHLDLVQWATDPVWGQIRERSIRERLLAEGVPHLRALLANSPISLLLLNGRAVVEQFQRSGLGTVEMEAPRIALGRGSCSLLRGTVGGALVLGWSTNLQSSFGVTRDFRAELSKWVRQNASTPGKWAVVEPTRSSGGL